MEIKRHEDMIYRALTVAGSDSGGGAGIQADLKTFTALSVFGSSVIVALTAQNSLRVTGIHEVPPEFVGQQMDAVLSDIGTDASKTGMLFSSEIIRTVAKKYKEYGVKKITVDPVMVSKTGSILLKKEAISSLMDVLAPLTYLITPNVPEAEILSGIKITGKETAIEAAVAIHNSTGAGVLLKGGHLSETKESRDILYDGRKITEFAEERIETRNTHGTGDTLSAAITAFLAGGTGLEDSIRNAKKYLQGAIRNSFPMGRGYGSLSHFWMNEDSLKMKGGK